MAATATQKDDYEKQVMTENSFDLESHLKSFEFFEFSKLKSDIDSGKLKLKDILGMTESEIKEMLRDEYHVSVVQRSRFVNAIKSLPKSKMNNPQGL